jgi:hypothetical protein
MWVVAATFADICVQVGKITAIQVGVLFFGLKALESLNPFVAIAAGVALIAVGTSVALSNAAGGGGGQKVC